MSTSILVGAGPVGIAAAEGALAEGVTESVVAVVDPDATHREVAARRLSALAVEKLADVPDAEEGDWAIVAYTSRAEVVAPEIMELVSRGYHVVTTCEELAFPSRHIREALSTAAVSDGRRIVAAGANPGFLMDRLPLALAGGVRSIRSISVERRVDTSTRRDPLVRKTGRGLTPEAFRAAAAAGSIGHVGLVASARLLGRGLTWPIHDTAETIEPILGDDGLVRGLHQTATLRTPEGGSLSLDLVMAWQVDRPGDTIEIDGSPPIRAELPDGYHGDEGTTAQVVNAIGRHTSLPPGFYRPIDIPLRFS
jgi:4-hydroxy-tetrahydrodipicolinate reductase